MYDVLRTIMLLLAIGSGLAGCEWVKQYPTELNSGKDGYYAQNMTPPEPPKMMIRKTADATWVEPTQIREAVEVKTEAEIRTEIATEEERLARLERNLMQMQKDLNTLTPAITQLAQNQQIVQAQQQVQQPPVAIIPGDTASTMTVASAPAVASTSASARPTVLAADTAPTVPIASLKSLANVTDIRFGAHMNKTRLVLDMNSPVEYRYYLDNAQQKLVLRLPETQWNTMQAKALTGLNFISGYAVSPNEEQGVDVVLMLKSPIQIMGVELLEPVNENSYRLTLDLGAL